MPRAGTVTTIESGPGIPLMLLTIVSGGRLLCRVDTPNFESAVETAERVLSAERLEHHAPGD